MADFSAYITASGISGQHPYVYLWLPSTSVRELVPISVNQSWSVYKITDQPPTDIISVGVNHDFGSPVTPEAEIRFERVTQDPTIVKLGTTVTTLTIVPGSGILLARDSGGGDAVNMMLSWSENLR